MLHQFFGPLRVPFAAVLDHRSLTWELAKRDVLGRYRGAGFGLLWSLISPFLMLLIYAFAFSTVLGSRWPEVESGGASFAIVLFAALIVHGFFAEFLQRAPALILNNSTLVKRVVFPLEILPWPMMFSAVFHALANALVFLVLQCVLDGGIKATAWLFPLVLLPLAFLGLVVSWLLAGLSVYLRDITQVIPFLAMALLFVSSALVPLAAIPERYRIFFELNPLSFIMEQSRDVLVRGVLPDFAGLALYMVLALLLCFPSAWLFMRLRRGFADVL